jgi:hypothetical protein
MRASPSGMNTLTLDRVTRLLRATHWPAIAIGVFLALAVQSLLVRLGFAIAVNDARVGSGYGLWVVLVELAALALGGAVAASASHAPDRAAGIAAGVMTWAVALVVGAISHGVVIGRDVTTEAVAWTGFFAALLGLGAAVGGGIFGVSLRERQSLPRPDPYVAT